MDFSKILQELEGMEWGEPDEAPTSLVRRCLELRRVPLNQMSAEDCRLLLGQKIGVPFILPLALNFLVDNPMEGGDMLPGTLLRYVLDIPETFWRTHPNYWWEAKAILLEVETIREQIELMLPAMKRLEVMEVG